MTVIEGTSTEPAVEWRTGRYRHRLIPDATTGELHEYVRTSTYSKALDDKEGLMAWKAWMALKGASVDKRLREQALHASRTPKGVIDALAEAGGGNEKRDRGSARHQILAMALLGLPLPDMPPQSRAELDAVLRLIDGLGTVTAVEAPNVCDEYRTAGSVDLVLDGRDGRTVVADFKTGRDQRLATGIQLACYARARFWDFATETRGELVAPNEPRLVALHAPQDGGEPRALDIDPQQAKAWAQLAGMVRRARSEASALSRRDAA